MASTALKVLSNTLEDIALVLPVPASTAVGVIGKLASKTHNIIEAKEMSKTNQQLVVQLAERSLVVARMIELYVAQSRPQDKGFYTFVENLSTVIKDVLKFVEKFQQQWWFSRFLGGNEVKSDFENLWRRLDALADDYRVYLLQNMASRGPCERIEHPDLREFWSLTMNNVLEAKWVDFWDSLMHSFPGVRQLLSGPSASSNKAMLQAKAVAKALPGRDPRDPHFVGPWEINNIFQPPNCTVVQIISTALAYDDKAVARTVIVAKATGIPNKICTRTVTCWTGYWRRGSYQAVMTAELLVAANHRIYGGGSDEIGQFTCTGEWGRRGTEVHFVKHYIGLHQVEYDGAICNTSMNGKWTKDRGMSTKGDFLLQQQTELSCNIVPNEREAEILKLGEIQRWSGYYKHCQGESKCDMNADIVFTCTHRIYGSGEDRVGRFSLLGHYHQTSPIRRAHSLREQDHSILVTINKQYENGRHILYMGAVLSHSLSVGQEDLKVVMEGSWVINTSEFSHKVDHGKFSLQPEDSDNSARHIKS